MFVCVCVCVYIYIYIYIKGLFILTVVIVTLNCTSYLPQIRYVLRTGVIKLEWNLSVNYKKVCNSELFHTGLCACKRRAQVYV